MPTSASTTSPALYLDGVAASYGGAPAVEGVTATLDAGDAVAVIGPNGAGKSTLMKAILGLVPVVAGRIGVLGRTPAGARGDVAYVPQEEQLDPEFPVSAFQVVLMGRYRRIGWLRRPGAADRELAGDALGRVGLADHRDDTFGELSGGQRQRVLLARALVQQAHLLLLDEPFNGLDTPTTDLVLGVIADLRAEGVAVVISTHDLTLAERACDRALLLNRRQVAFGPIDDALDDANLRTAYGIATSRSGERIVDTHHGHH